MIYERSLRICGCCEGARWVVAHSGRPFHGGAGGMPCPECNAPEDGDMPLGWRPTCLDCSTLEDFMTAYPDDPDVILTQMEAQLGDLAEPEGTANFTTLGPLVLIRMKQQLTNELVELDELTGQRTPRGRVVHSELAACIAELRARRLM